ncbi:hypothetical protein BDP81DRAFT_94477 [Colletotrichum phormii]|uniref:Uncharacterized protein n=1 Tax=Colletotrichum phormii TaxID=359342 RepID=A0AAJ0EKF1_9PEZI|nr:uncharacterized protein BDP81DRAFT_94477 [Colletotrichum phormii]KAK1655126.1 hypothetical protein BDP81DRAFT_94477 [Colletotrichum phormii]
MPSSTLDRVHTPLTISERVRIASKAPLYRLIPSLTPFFHQTFNCNDAACIASQPLLQGADTHLTRLTNIDTPTLELFFLYSSDLERSSVAPPSVALIDRLLHRPSDPAALGITLAVDCPAARLTCQVARDVTANFFNAAQRSPRPLKVLKRYPLRFGWSSSSRHHPYASRISPSRLRPNK